MPRDLESLAKSIAGEKSSQLDLRAITAMVDSPEGKNLMKTLSGSGGDALKKAASAAADGDSGAAGRLLSSLMSSKEGQALAQQVMALGKKK